MKKISKSTEETEKLGGELAKKLIGKKEIVALYGNLGAGKTAFVRGFARGFGCKDEVTSPTFAIVHEYSYLCHFDMYRVTNYEDLCSTGFFDYLQNKAMIIEWSENIEVFLPINAIKVKFLPGTNEEERMLNFENISY